MFLSEAMNQTGTFFHLVPWAVLFPVLGLLINMAFGRRMGEKGVAAVAVTASGLSFVVAVLMWLSLRVQPAGATVPFLSWMTPVHIAWAFRVDTLSVTMMLVVSGVGTLIHLYAVGYMHYDVRYKGDPGRYARFFVFLNLFIAAMMILVTGDSYLMLFVGWEGVGLCSYLLISFWFEYDTKGNLSLANAKAGNKAFIANRIGDFGFLLGMFYMFSVFGTLNFGKVFSEAPHVAQTHPQAILAITLLLLLGVTGKSAQIPLYVWLPDAMAGPTPVSALIHAATMVTAGVYLIARSHVLYDLVPAAQHTVALVGALTALFAATIAVAQNDIKKVLAYSTISQLGFMVAAVGVGAYVAAMFHLVAHAFFKALLFLAAGSVIIALERAHHPLPEEGGHAAHHNDDPPDFDPQDMRFMGGLRKVIPITFWTYLIAGLTLAGIPPLAAFFSKDEIIADTKAAFPLVYWLLVLAAFLTAFYIGRQIFLVFFGKPRSHAAAHAKESPWTMTSVLIILAALSALGGLLNWPHPYLAEWLGHTLGEVEAAGLNPLVAGTSATIAIVSFLLAWWVYGKRPLQSASQPDPLQRPLGWLFTAMQAKWWVDELYWAVVINPYIALCRIAAAFDVWVIDAAVNDTAWLTDFVGEKIARWQTGFVRNYALSVFVGVLLIFTYLLWR